MGRKGVAGCYKSTAMVLEHKVALPTTHTQELPTRLSQSGYKADTKWIRNESKAHEADTNSTKQIRGKYARIDQVRNEVHTCTGVRIRFVISAYREQVCNEVHTMRDCS